MELQEVEGITTEFYIKRASKEHNLKIVVIPGNPGIIDFYEPFIELLYEKLGQLYDIIGVAHAGHSELFDPKVHSLDDQIQHKIDVLHYLLSKNAQSHFILIGHSVGAYISLKIWSKRKDLGIRKVVCLFPTIKHLWNGLAPAVKLFILPGFRHMLSTLVHFSPRFINDLLIGMVSSQSDEARYVTSSKVNYYLVMNILYMAYTEGQQILEIDDDCRGVISANLGHLYFLYGPTDQYTPKEYFEEMRQIYPNGNIEMAEEGVKHAFVLRHSEVVACKVVEFLSAQLQNGAE